MCSLSYTWVDIIAQKGFALSIIRNCPVLSWPKVVVRYNLDFISTFGLLSLHTGKARYVAGVVVVPK